MQKACCQHGFSLAHLDCLHREEGLSASLMGCMVRRVQGAHLKELQGEVVLQRSRERQEAGHQAQLSVLEQRSADGHQLCAQGARGRGRPALRLCAAVPQERCQLLTKRRDAAHVPVVACMGSQIRPQYAVEPLHGCQRKFVAAVRRKGNPTECDAEQGLLTSARDTLVAPRNAGRKRSATTRRRLWSRAGLPGVCSLPRRRGEGGGGSARFELRRLRNASEPDDQVLRCAPMLWH